MNYVEKIIEEISMNDEVVLTDKSFTLKSMNNLICFNTILCLNIGSIKSKHELLEETQKEIGDHTYDILKDDFLLSLVDEVTKDGKLTYQGKILSYIPLFCLYDYICSNQGEIINKYKLLNIIKLQSNYY